MRARRHQAGGTARRHDFFERRRFRGSGGFPAGSRRRNAQGRRALHRRRGAAGLRPHRRADVGIPAPRRRARHRHSRKAHGQWSSDRPAWWRVPRSWRSSAKGCAISTPSAATPFRPRSAWRCSTSSSAKVLWRMPRRSEVICRDGIEESGERLTDHRRHPRRRACSSAWRWCAIGERESLLPRRRLASSTDCALGDVLISAAGSCRERPQDPAAAGVLERQRRSLPHNARRRSCRNRRRIELGGSGAKS